jgi:Fe-S oxidoreductase
MALEDFRADALRCTRCSYCKWIPFDLVKSWRFSKGCPSVDYANFHSYSGGGRLITMLSLMDGRSEVNDRVVDIAYKCQLCGNCDVACKVCRYDMEPLAGIREFRRTLNEQGHVPAAYPGLIAKLREAGNMAGHSQADRPKWAEGLGLKRLGDVAPGAGDVDKAEILFHAGCRYSFDPSLRAAVRAAATVLKSAGVDFALDSAEGCCGGKAYDMGYRDDFARAAQANLERWSAAGVKTVVTPCATCYHTFKRLYPDLGSTVEVLHTVELVDRSIKDGSLKLTTAVPMTVTYHDPCHLGRQGEPHVPWDGVEKKIYGQAVVYDPPRPRYIGAYGIYDPPRDVLKAIPGLELVEMDRNREAAWCCGAGGSVREAYPEFNAWTAGERLEEAKTTGAEALVTACPGCEKNFAEAVSADGAKMRVLDVLELVEQAL